MKSKKLIYVLFLLAFVCNNYIMQAQELDVNGCPVLSGEISDSFDETISNSSQNINEDDTIRALDELNTGLAEAYPYISPDGLRLYFIHGDTENNIYFAFRTSLDTAFRKAELLSSQIPGDNRMQGCWLTSDELELFYVYNSNLYYTSRSSMTAPFSAPVAVSLIGLAKWSLIGPSLTPDKQELYINNYSYPNYTLCKFVKTGSLQYTLNDTINVPDSLTASAGQLSKDGLKYFVCLKNKTKSKAKLFRFSRETIGSDFSNLCQLDTNINNYAFNYQTQPSVTSDEKILVWVRSTADMWTANNLYIAENYIITHKKEIAGNSLKVYPNPANNIINVSGIHMQNAVLSIFNSVGILVHRQKINKENHEVNISRLPKGIYMLQVTYGSGKTVQKIIKE